MINGIHHITALASDPQRNLDFYVGVLGLRLVKRTVNFDAPDVYHLYYGDEIGQPGTILTFFPFPNAARGKRGIGEIGVIAFSAPESSTEYWVERLSRQGIHFDGPSTRFGDSFIAFQDPDGMQIELVFKDTLAEYHHWEGSPVPAEFALRRFHGATLVLGRREETDWVLTNVLGFRYDSENNNRFRYRIGVDNTEVMIDLLLTPTAPVARQSAGSIHHIAWRVGDDASQQRWRESIAAAGIRATEILDRNYFHSVYFREPGGVLFEIATDPPGFAVDESVNKLGEKLKLPLWLEPSRAKLERTLPPLELAALSNLRKLAY